MLKRKEAVKRRREPKMNKGDEKNEGLEGRKSKERR